MDGLALDLFTGTSTVAQEFKEMGFVTHANDWQYYSYITAKASVELNQMPTFERLRLHIPIDPEFEVACPNGISLLLHSTHTRTKQVSSKPAYRVLWYLKKIDWNTLSLNKNTMCLLQKKKI